MYLTSKKGNYTVDHNSIVKEIDQVQKKQRVHKAHMETRLTVKMEQLNPVSPMLVTKKSTMFFSLPTFSSYKFHAGRPKQVHGDLQNHPVSTFPAIGPKIAQLIYKQRELRGKVTGISQKVSSEEPAEMLIGDKEPKKSRCNVPHTINGHKCT